MNLQTHDLLATDLAEQHDTRADAGRHLFDSVHGVAKANGL